MRADATHRVHRDRATDHFAVLAAMRIGPRNRQCEVTVERSFGKFARDTTNRFRRNTAALAHRSRRILRIEIALGEQMKDRNCGAAIGECVFANDGGRDVDRVRVDWRAPT